ncbi:ATP-dependent DNA helicase RecQ-like [Branchiostoma floridae]|uniref:DNA 3'-5' helicase n=1 Tax=Branchiostoma floridae TaxID=7739 RepID=A0A9J7MAH3_BRAFL|nr:ATP-dependent DNA helicase RecQ-like [Branchiostoma floridae]XP_035697618.1 ATP-dependent DNA helicase RecQ-like [Branchiostoma floridae]XP_035697625.1 ATP-dependent DNA helicase RecQ-like [Branchiostoma floridae]
MSDPRNPTKVPTIIKGSLDRKNIFLVPKKIYSIKEDLGPLIHMIEKAEDAASIEKHIVYAGKKQKCIDIWELLTAACKSTTRGTVRTFHADMSRKAKDDILQGFRDGRIRIIVATVAFGIGIDFPDVKGVVAYGMPSTIGQLYQQIGRAGRRGDPAHAVLFFNKADNTTHGPMKDIYKADCPRKAILNHLGQEAPDLHERCCSVHNTEDQDCIFTADTSEGTENNTKRRRPRPKRRQDTDNEDRLEAELLMLRDEWCEQRPELLLIGPCGIMSDDTVERIKTDCHTIHTSEDLKMVKCITGMSEHYL